MSLSDHNQRHPKKIGLALGSGSARGWAHIGVIQALSEAGIRVDCVAGTSIGAMVGAVYASGKIDELEEIVLQFDWKHILHFFDIVFPKSGLIDGMKVADFIRSHVKEKNIEELPIPFRAVTTDLTTGHEVVIQNGDIIEAVSVGGLSALGAELFSIGIPKDSVLQYETAIKSDKFLIIGGC